MDKTKQFVNAVEKLIDATEDLDSAHRHYGTHEDVDVEERKRVTRAKRRVIKLFNDARCSVRSDV